MKLVDTHQHLLYPDEVVVPWTVEYPVLKDKPFRLEEYAEATRGYEIEKSLFMEVDVAECDMAREAAFVSKLSQDPNNALVGMIAACRPEQDGFRAHLDSIACEALKGMRRVLHVVPDEISTTELFRDNIRLLADYELPFDLCYLSRQLGLGYELVKACPEVSFVLDHCGNPDIEHGEFETWVERMEKLATLPNVNCKLSGVSVDCGDKFPDAALIHPYLDECLRIFGPERLVFGSDWPVCLFRVELSVWLGVFTSWVEKSLSADEAKAICQENACRIYKL